MDNGEAGKESGKHQADAEGAGHHAISQKNRQRISYGRVFRDDIEP